MRSGLLVVQFAVLLLANLLSAEYTVLKCMISMEIGMNTFPYFSPRVIIDIEI